MTHTITLDDVCKSLERTTIAIASSVDRSGSKRLEYRASGEFVIFAGGSEKHRTRDAQDATDLYNATQEARS